MPVAEDPAEALRRRAEERWTAVRDEDWQEHAMVGRASRPMMDQVELSGMCSYKWRNDFGVAGAPQGVPRTN